MRRDRDWFHEVAYRSPMHRLFVALRPPESIRDVLVDAMDESPEFRWQTDEQLHLTLRFIGEVDRPVANDLADSFARLHAHCFTLRIDGTGMFAQRSAGLLWASVEPKAPVAALAAKIERACQENGLDAERRAFHPHITLARWKGRRTREAHEFLGRTRGLSTDPFDVTEFTLFESRLSRHGAHYEPVATYSLSR